MPPIHPIQVSLTRLQQLTGVGLNTASGFNSGLVFSFNTLNPAIFNYSFSSAHNISSFLLNNFVGGIPGDNYVRDFTLTLRDSMGTQVGTISDTATGAGGAQSFAITASNVSTAQLTITSVAGNAGFSEIAEIGFEGSPIP